MLNLFYYDFGVRLIKPDPNIYYRTKIGNANTKLTTKVVGFFLSLKHATGIF